MEQLLAFFFGDFFFLFPLADWMIVLAMKLGMVTVIDEVLGPYSAADSSTDLKCSTNF